MSIPLKISKKKKKDEKEMKIDGVEIIDSQIELCCFCFVEIMIGPIGPKCTYINILYVFESKKHLVMKVVEYALPIFCLF